MSDSLSRPVTFLVADVVGGSRHQNRLYPTTSLALPCSDSALRRLVATYGGLAFNGAGGGIWAAFEDAGAALQAALAIRTALQSRRNDTSELSVRVALNSGDAERRGDDYVGAAVSRLGVLVKATQDGQVLASEATIRLARAAPPADVRARRAGQLELRDLAAPLDVYEVFGAPAAQAAISAPSVDAHDAPPTGAASGPQSPAGPTVARAASSETPDRKRRGGVPSTRRPSAAGVATTLRVYTLGGFRLERDGRDIHVEHADTNKGLQLFRCLLSRPSRRLPREQAYELFWPESRPEAAATTIRTSLRRLRESIEPGIPHDESVVEIAHEMVRIRPGADIWVDADELERLVSEARRTRNPDELLEAADRLHRGEYLPDDVYDEWAIRRRDELRRLWASLQIDLAGSREGRGDVDGAISALQRLFDQDRCRDRSAQELMLILARHGARSTALQVYQQHGEALKALMGGDDAPIEPDSETRRIRHEILAAQAPSLGTARTNESTLGELTGRVAARASDREAMPPPPSQISPARRNALPAQTNALIGRLDEVETVRKRLLDPNVRLLTLTGIGGSGKTRLSLAVAETLIASYSLADGIYYVDLAAVSDPAMMMPSIALALGVREPADRSLADCMREAIGQSELLLVLDNLEQVVDAAPELAALLAACPRLTILTTSRTALRIRGEWVIQVNPLPLPDPVLLRGRGVAGVAELADAPAVRLFVERAREVRPDFAVTPENATVVAQICRRLDGLPLAIELAAARARMFSPRALLERLSRPLDLLTGGARDLPARQQTMRDAIAWSYGLLPPAERALFRRLAIFPGGCSLEAVRYVCDVDEEFDLDPIDGLRTLVDTSLIQPVEGVGGEPRFRMLDTVREYGQERLADDDTPALYVRRHATYCLAFAEEAEAGIEGQEQASWLARLETEQDNVRAVLNWALNNGEYTIALRLGGALWRSWRRHGSAHDGRAQLDAALSHGAMVEPEIRLKALIASAELACHEGKVGRAIELCKESLTLCEALGDLAAKAQSLHILGWCTAYDARSDDDYRLARTYQEECLALQRQRGHQPGEAKALHELGEIARYLHEYETARSDLELALAMRRSLGDAEGAGWSTHCLAWTAYDQGRYDHAMRQAVQASDIWRRTKNDHGTATTANLRARIAWKRADVAQAAREVGVSLRLWSALQSHESLSYALIFVAGMALKLRPDRRGALRVARILATAELLRDDRPPPTHRRHEVDEIDAALATHLDEYARLVAREKGRAMSADTATHLAAEMARRWSRPAPRR